MTGSDTEFANSGNGGDGMGIKAQASPWFGRHPRLERVRVTLFCLPFSGASQARPASSVTP
jgi:hypothetical protein